MHSASGVITINGVIAAVVGAVTTWVLNNASTIAWDRVVYVGIGVAIGVFLILTIVVKRLRELIWRRSVRWLWSWRPVSARRHARELALAREAADAGENAVRDLAVRADAAIAQVRDSLQRVTLTIATQMNENKSAVEELRKDLDRAAAKESAAQPEPTQPRVIPSPAPRWRLVAPSERIDQNADDGKYLLQNLIPGSVAKNVRVENDGVGYFDFEDGAFWLDMSGVKSNGFGGTITRADHAGNIRLRLSYYDSLVKERHVYFSVNRDGRIRQLSDEELSIRI